MPPDHDAGALLDELMKLKLFAVEIRDSTATLVPAEMASAKPAKADRVTLATSGTPEFAARVRAFAASQGKKVSDVVHAALTDYLATA
jgi:hypothetical protein